MLNIITDIFSEVIKIIKEDQYELPLISPKNPVEERWFPMSDLEEIVIIQ